MNTKELRIGNLVNVGDWGPRYVYSIFPDSVELAEDESGENECEYSPSEITPIPLTQDWLFALGGVKEVSDPSGYAYGFNIVFHTPLVRPEIVFWTGDGCIYVNGAVYPHIEYVHQL